MHKPIFFAGIALIIAGIAILLYGLNFSSQFTISAGEWQVTWYSMQNTRGLWGSAITSAKFPTNFSYDPLELYTRSEPIGFRATLIIDVPREIKVRLTIGGDDGEIYLFLDGREILSLICHDPNNITSTETTLTVGRHTLELAYFQVLLEDDPAAQFEIMIPEQRVATNIMTVGGIISLIGVFSTIMGLLWRPERV
ncbi:hypothetical protein KEJ12_07510 [Candidatus Bathyarchaeota archaeon]|nr:hypothetical protein [Candidatus Bathyarchaeota archaeon]